MKRFENKTVTAFISSLCRATAKEEIPDAAREAHKAIVESYLKTYSFIPKELYTRTEEGIQPTSACLSQWHDQLNARFSVLVPFRIYDNSINLGEHVMQDRSNTAERIKLVNSCLEFVVKNAELITSQIDSTQLKMMNTLGILYNYLLNETPTGKEFTRLHTKEEE